jgi:predicted PurR-regulated permease PerM
MDEKKVVIEFSFKTILWVLAAVLAIWLVVTLKDVLVVILLAFILATAITPLVDFLQRKKVPRTISVAGVMLAVLGLIFLVIRLIVPPFATEMGNILSNRTEYVLKITSYIQHLSPILRDNITVFLNNFLGTFGNLNFDGVVSSAKGVFNGIMELIIVLVLSFYLLQNNKGVEGVIVSYIPKQHQKRIQNIYHKISEKMSQWMRGQIFLGLIIFAVNLVGLSILKVNYALTLAVISGLLEVLPIIGPIVAGGLAVLIALTQSPLLALIVLAWYLLVQQLENHILVPQVMKKSLGLNPVVIIVAIIIGGKLLGIIGILVAVPVAAAIGVLMEEFVKQVEGEAK